MTITTLSTKGQVVIPKIIRDTLGISTSDVLEVTTDGEKVIMNPLPQVNDMMGTFKTDRSLTKKDMKNTIKEAREEKFENKKWS